MNYTHPNTILKSCKALKTHYLKSNAGYKTLEAEDCLPHIHHEIHIDYYQNVGHPINIENRRYALTLS